MLKSISINGYRQLKEFAIDDLKSFNLLVGPNNSGKSSFLEAVLLHCGPLNFHMILAILSIRLGGFNIEPALLYENIKSLFSISDQKIDKIVINSKWNAKARETTISLVEGNIGLPLLHKVTNSEIASGTMGTSGTSNIVFIDRKSHESEGFLAGSVVLGFGTGSEKSTEITIDLVTGQPLRLVPPKIKTDIPAILSDPFMHRGRGSGINEYGNAIKKGLHKKIIELLGKLDKHIRDIVILPAEDKTSEFWVDYENKGLMPLSNLGDGVRRVILIASQIVNCEKGVFLIDELESSIHQRALQEFVNWLIKVCEESSIQLFATTHSLECVDAVLGSELINLSELNLLKMNQQNDKIQAQKVSGESLKEIRYELGQDVRG